MKSSLFVSEACEAFRALDHWRPRHCIVTNLDDEHTEHYGDREHLCAAFADLLARVPNDGAIALCGDDPGLAPLIARNAARVVTYGLGPGTSLSAGIVRAEPDATEFEVFSAALRYGRVRLPVPGRHNVRNALGALALALSLGVPFATAAEALRQFVGIGRRWELVGEACGVRVFDDFAHHPTEIAATLAVARAALAPGGSVVAVVQPQLHSRVARLAREFAEALSAADLVLVLPVDAAGEPRPVRLSDDLLAAALGEAGLDIIACANTNDVPMLVGSRARSGDIVLTMGPRPVECCGPAILRAILDSKDRNHTKPFIPNSLPRLAEFSGRHLDIKRTERLQSGFERQAARQPEAPCLRDEDVVWSYGDLEQWANRVARQMIDRGVGPDSLVVLHLEKSPRLVALIVGVLKSGAAYVPLDPRMDRNNLAATLKGAGAELVITQNSRTFDADMPNSIVYLDDFWSALASQSPTAPECPAAAHHLAYAIFTSGSTGRPHLVGVEHRNVVNVIDYAMGALIDPEDLRIVPFTDSISFDGCVHQIFMTLGHGGTLLIERDLANLMRSRWMEEITSLSATPSILRDLVEATDLPTSVRVVLLGGEVIPPDLIARLHKVPSLRKVFNFYGPTETTIYSTVSRLLDRSPAVASVRVDRPNGRVIGYPIFATRVYLVGKDERLVPDGAIGEIYIAGAGVTCGYLDAAELTAERFVPDPFAHGPGERCYRTGDLGRRIEDGSIEFIGRLDDQFKLNGIRLEPAEIETHIEACPGIRRAAVVVQGRASADPQLVAYVVPEPDADLAQIRRLLEPRLPAVMIPKALIPVESLPLTASGKLDRRALAYAAPNEAPGARPSAPPRDEVERCLVTIWRKVLRRPSLGVDDDFFDLGGDSLASMQLLLTVEREIGVWLDVEALENLGSVTDMAVHVRRRMAQQQTGRREALSEFDETMRKQKAYVGAWVGQRHAKGSLIVTLNALGRRRGLFWCLQSYGELAQLAAELGSDQPVHGMRSGDLVMSYTPDTVAALADHYAREMVELQPDGPFQIGGNCQGGTIARATALTLRGMGRKVSRLILMELGSFWPYDEPVALIFGRDSHLNPYRRLPDPDAIFCEAYRDGFSIDLIDGSHGEFFSPRNIVSLGAVIRQRLKA